MTQQFGGVGWGGGKFLKITYVLSQKGHFNGPNVCW
jgi:hypothetical protein